MNLKEQIFKISGQSLLEVLIGLGISVIMISAATASLFLVLRSSNANQQTQISNSLANALLDNLTAFSDSNWSGIYSLNKGDPNYYYLATSTGRFVAQSGQEQVTIGDIVYNRYFYVENVSRDPSSRNIQETYSASNEDPSTQKVTIRVGWNLPTSPGSLEIISYLTRKNLNFAQQINWRGSSGVSGPVIDFGDSYFSASGIDTSSASGSIKITGF